MKRAMIFLIGLTAISIMVANGIASEDNMPIVKGEKTIATINGEAVTLKELNRELVSLHEESMGKKPTISVDKSSILERIIDARLVLQEARNIGLDELPALKNGVRSFKNNTLRDLLFKSQVRNLKPDEKEVETIYKAAVKEVKVHPVIFANEEDAKTLEREVRNGGNFEESSKAMISAGKAEGKAEGEYVTSKGLLPQIAEALSKMKVGEISPVINVGNKFAITKFEDVRFPENPEARETARTEALQRKRINHLKTYTESLVKKNAKIDRKILSSLDYESKENGISKLLKDKRIVATVKGGNPVTVGEFSKEIQAKYFHGMQSAVDTKSINKEKNKYINELLLKKVIILEALRLKIDKKEEFKYEVNRYEKNMLFGIFIQKVIDPSITVGETEKKEYYEKHASEYTLPEMIKIHSISFSSRENARNAFEKLRNGVDYQWVKANVPGQLGEKTAEKPLKLEGSVLTTSSLPEDLRKTIDGAVSGDYRFFADADGKFHVLFIQDRHLPKQRLFEEVKEDIEKKVFLEKRRISMENWIKKLREASDIKIYVKKY